MSHTYLTTQELSELIKYNPRTIRNELKDSVLIEGIHYIRPFGGRKILYIWEEAQREQYAICRFLLYGYTLSGDDKPYRHAGELQEA